MADETEPEEGAADDSSTDDSSTADSSTDDSASDSAGTGTGGDGAGADSTPADTSNGSGGNANGGTNPSVMRTASRQVAGDPTFSAMTPSYEVRKIILARGVQFHNDSAGEHAIPDYLVSKIGSNVQTLSDGSTVYNNDDQHVTYVLTQVTKKSDFKTALETAGVHVVYCGHARFGEGMCFGDVLDPGENWGNGTDNDTGQWRVGFPFLALPVTSDILEHQFTVNPVSGADAKPALADCHPHVRNSYGSMKVQDISTFDPSLPSFLGSADTSNGFWGFDAHSEAGKYERHILCHCGWSNTATTPMDLAGTNLSCKVFTCIGCSTFIHNFPVVRKLSGWTRNGDDRYAYWTSSVTYSSVMTAFWLHRLFTYPKRNDNQPWEASLKWAVQKANQDYINAGPAVAAHLI